MWELVGVINNYLYLNNIDAAWLLIKIVIFDDTGKIHLSEFYHKQIDVLCGYTVDHEY